MSKSFSGKLRLLFSNHTFQFWMIFLIIFLVRFHPFLQGKTLFFGDNYSLMVPGKIFTANWIKQGVLPLWNPYIFSGTPWVADINQSVFYPSTLLFVFFSPATAFNLSITSHLLISFAGMYLLAKFWFKDHFWALLAAVFWALSPQTLTLINNITTFRSIAWFPWIIYASLRLIKEPRWRVYFALLVLIQFIAGYPQHIIFAILTAVLLSVFQHWRKISIKNWLKIWFNTAILTVSITAVVWMPFIDMLSHSTRLSQSADQSVVGSLQPAMLLQFFIPKFFDNPAAGLRWGPAWNGQLNQGLFITWFGWLAILLSLFFSSKKVRKEILFFAGIILVTTIFSLGQFLPGFSVIQKLLPILQITRYPSMALLVANVALILWVVRALQQLQKNFPSRIKNLFLTAGFVSLIVGASGWFLAETNFNEVWSQLDNFGFYSLSQSLFHTAERDKIILLELSKIIVFHSIFYLASFYIFLRSKTKNWFFLLLIFITGEMLFATHRDQFFFAPASIYESSQSSSPILKMEALFPSNFQVRILTRNSNIPYTDYSSYWEAISVRKPFSDSFVDDQELVSFNHAINLKDGLTPNWNIAFNVPVVHGYATLLSEEYSLVWSEDNKTRINFIDYILPTNPLLDDWAVKYYLVDTWFLIKEDLSDFPVVAELDRWQVLERPEAKERIRFKDDSQLELIEFREDPNSMNLVIDNIDSKSSLLIADSYDRDWRVEINGKEGVINNYRGMREIELVDGINTIRLWYYPQWLYIGIAISLVSGLGAIIYMKERS